MTQSQHSEQCRFLLKCQAAYQLVQDFLNDQVITKKNPPLYTFLPSRREEVKHKVRKSLEVLETSLERHRYVQPGPIVRLFFLNYDWREMVRFPV